MFNVNGFEDLLYINEDVCVYPDKVVVNNTVSKYNLTRILDMCNVIKGDTIEKNDKFSIFKVNKKD